MTTGIVKWFNTEKGYGFIEPKDDGNDIFVYISQLQKSGIDGLMSGQTLSFEIDMKKGKPNAIDLQIIQS